MRIEAEDTQGLLKLVEYFLRCPFSQARMIEVTCLRQGFGRQAAESKVLYKTEHNRLGHYPEAASENLLAGPKRNFQVFDPLDLKEVEKGDTCCTGSESLRAAQRGALSGRGGSSATTRAFAGARREDSRLARPRGNARREFRCKSVSEGLFP